MTSQQAATPDAILTGLYEAAVRGVNPFFRTREAVKEWLSSHAQSGGELHIFALGKAAWAMAAGSGAAVSALHQSVTGGVIVSHFLPDNDFELREFIPPPLRHCVGDHPVPGPSSLEAAEQMDAAIQDIAPGALVLVLLSGGTTALTAAPITALAQSVGDTGRAQAHIANLAETLLEGGLAIHEMNAIRRRVLRFGAGRLATALARRGVRRVGVFAISDVIGDDPAVIGSGPCTPDPLDDTHFLALLDAHNLRGRLEHTMEQILGISGNGGPLPVPSATDPAFNMVDYSIVAGNGDALRAMAESARDMGIGSVSTDFPPLEGDAQALGEQLVEEALNRVQPAPSPADLTPAQAALSKYHVSLLGGEPVVNLEATTERAMALAEEDDARHVTSNMMHGTRQTQLMADEPMRGGRMQVLALSAALAIEAAVARDHPLAAGITILAAGTDGRDGPTDAAGAIVNAAVPYLARRAGRIPESDLETGRSWFSLNAARALLRTGPTGTNVMDVVAILSRRPH